MRDFKKIHKNKARELKPFHSSRFSLMTMRQEVLAQEDQVKLRKLILRGFATCYLRVVEAQAL